MNAPKSLKKIWDSLFDRPTQVVDGARIWRLDRNVTGVLHRDHGRPAIVRDNGSKEWWVNGKLNREGGPAVQNADGTELWYRDGVPLAEAAIKALHEPKKHWWNRQPKPGAAKP